MQANALTYVCHEEKLLLLSYDSIFPFEMAIIKDHRRWEHQCGGLVSTFKGHKCRFRLILWLKRMKWTENIWNSSRSHPKHPKNCACIALTGHNLSQNERGSEANFSFYIAAWAGSVVLVGRAALGDKWRRLVSKIGTTFCFEFGRWNVRGCVDFFNAFKVKSSMKYVQTSYVRSWIIALRDTQVKHCTC